MKKIFTLVILLAIGLGVFAQSYSSLSPTLVVWNADGQKYSLRRAAYGVPQPKALTLEVYFRKQDLRNVPSTLKLEFRWYYYLSTRRKFVKSEVISLQKAQETPDGAIKFTSTLYTVQPGWWEVQIVNSLDHRLIRYAKLNKFQVFVRRQVYVRR